MNNNYNDWSLMKTIIRYRTVEINDNELHFNQLQ